MFLFSLFDRTCGCPSASCSHPYHVADVARQRDHPVRVYPCRLHLDHRVSVSDGNACRDPTEICKPAFQYLVLPESVHLLSLDRNIPCFWRHFDIYGDIRENMAGSETI